MRSPAAVLLVLAISLTAGSALAVDYDIVYVRQPRYGDAVNTIWPDASRPARAEPGSDLVLLHPDGSEEVLVVGGNGAVSDPFVSFDGRWVYYTYFYDLRPEALNDDRDFLPLMGSDIFRINLVYRTVEQLTFGEFTPNTGAGVWDESNPLDPGLQFNSLGYGILNQGPAPLAGGKVMFTSNRNGFQPPMTFTSPTLQLFVMDEDGSNVTPVAPMTIGSALHPVPLRDGRVMFSTYESQALRDRRVWAVWSIYPDGRHFEPVLSGFRPFQTFHFMTQMGNEDIVVEDYYTGTNNGFGTLYRFPVRPPQDTAPFHSAFVDENPEIWRTNEDGVRALKISFSPWGIYSVTPFTTAEDLPAPIGAGGERVGKVTHPSAAPDGDLLVVWTPGAANDTGETPELPFYDGGIYLVPGGDEVWDPAELVLVKNDPAYNEAWPRAVVRYRDIHGVEEPVEIPWLPNDGTLHPELPAGTPFGLVGSSSLYKRESFPGWVEPTEDTFDGLDAFNSENLGHSSNWTVQGADAGKYDDSEIWALRVVAMEPNSHRSYGPKAGRRFESFANERLRILGEIPVRKPDGAGGEILDPEGNPDTSFLVKVPADTPFTFQTIDRDGMLLNMAQTWHQVRPGEVRTDCGGCHAHSQLPLDFEETEAAQPGFPVFDLSLETPLVTRNAAGESELDVQTVPLADVEFYRDIRPILQARCVSCHTQVDPDPPGNLVLDDLTLYDSLPGDYLRLAADETAQFGYPPVTGDGHWHSHNASRYIRKFQSRRSLLIWKLFGRRTDGWANEDHPTETVPGDPATLPPGTNTNLADLDYTGNRMPPPGGGVPRLTVEEKMTFARWIDLGAPIDLDPDVGWFLDDLRPTVTVSLPRPGSNQGALSVIRFGMADANSGVDLATLSVRADFAVSGRPAMAELADLAVEVDQGVWEVALGAPLPELDNRHVLVEVSDLQGNRTGVDREFSTTDVEGVYHRLIVAVDGTGRGAITSAPAGIACGLDCQEDYLEGTVVALTLTPEAGSTFVGWSGDPDCADATVALDAPKSCVAEFARLPVLAVGFAGAGSGSVSSQPSGIDCGADCTESYAFGTSVVLASAADAGSRFVGWSGDDDCADGSVDMIEDRTCVADFALEHVLTVAVSGSGSVASSPAGIDCEPTCSAAFVAGATVTLSAVPATDWAFDGWSGPADCADGVVTLAAKITCTASFSPHPVLSVSLLGQGSGTVTSAPAGIDCGSGCNAAFAQDTVVQLTATPAPGSVFVSWGGGPACAGGLVTMDRDRACTALFAVGQATLTVSKQGTGSGTVRSDPAGLFCGTTCQVGFQLGTVVSLLAIDAPGSDFAGWSGDADCADGVVTLTVPVACTATFEPTPSDQFPLAVVKSGTGTGRVTSSPGGIDCGADCSESYADGTAVVLTAAADPGSAFVTWAGDADCLDGTVTMSQAVTCGAQFALEPVLTVTKSGPGQGTVTSSPAGIDCGSDCSQNYPAGTQVTLTATPTPGSFFDGWSGAADCADGSVALTANTTCVATFVQRTLEARLSGSGAGTITSQPAGIDCPGDCFHDYADGRTVRLTATPAPGSLFDGWVGTNCPGGIVVLDADKVCTAIFNLPNLAVSKQGSGSGTITSAPAGIECGADCEEEYPAGTVVTLTVTPDPGTQFLGWTGSPDCEDGVVTLGGNAVCTAQLDVPTLTVQTFGPGSGTVTSSPAGIDCGTTCSADLPAGTLVTLTAVPDAGSTFVAWSGAPDCMDGIVTLTADVTCRARFN